MDKAQLKSRIIGIIDKLSVATDPVKAKETFAEELTNEIDLFVKTAVVKVIVQKQQINVSGSANSQTNLTQINLEGYLE